MTVQERQLRIAGVLEAVSTACNFVMEEARRAGLDDRAIHHCYLAVDEACTNIIEHGYSPDCDDCVIDIHCRRDDDKFIICIVDDSPAFDPLTFPDPDPKLPINRREPGGWGIFFIKKLMDQVVYQHDGNRNRLVMVKRIKTLRETLEHSKPATTNPIRVQEFKNNVWLITPSGRLDAFQSNHLSVAIAEQIDAGHKRLIIDMSGVETISSTGFKMLVSASNRARDMKGDLVLAALTPRVREVLEMIGLDLVFAITETVEKALKRFNVKSA